NTGVERQQPELIGAAYRLGARACVDLQHHTRNMMLDGPTAGGEPVRDLHIPQSLGEQRKDLELTIGQPLWICARPWARSTPESTPEPTRATLKEPPARNLHCWSRPKALKDGQCRALGRFIALQEGKGLFPGTTDPLPRARGGAPVTGHLRGVGGRRSWRR